MKVFSTRTGALLLGGLAAGKIALELAGLRRRQPIRGATAVVCGASRGLGRALALELAKRGGKKIAICPRTEDDLQHVVAKAGDMSTLAEVERFFAQIGDELGPIDILITNAATISVAPFAAWE